MWTRWMRTDGMRDRRRDTRMLGNVVMRACPCLTEMLAFFSGGQVVSLRSPARRTHFMREGKMVFAQVQGPQ